MNTRKPKTYYYSTIVTQVPLAFFVLSDYLLTYFNFAALFIVYHCKGAQRGKGTHPLPPCTGARRIFPRGGQIRGLGTKVPEQSPKIEPPVRVWQQSPQKPTICCENNA